MPELPTGTITFLFTDIEGSTRRWEQAPEAMQAALGRHDAELRHAIETHGGAVFKTVGDAFCAAFATAPDAVAAAAAAQRALATLATAGEAPLRVRMAIHTGVAERRDGDYFGPPLNRVARLLEAAHGGQVLLSQTAADLARESLPAEVALRDLGEHRLRDLVRPETVCQLAIAGLRSDFPALRSLTAFPNNLPLQPTSFVGRGRELAEVKRLLGQTRLLTLTGAGGVGKTRLSLQAAADMLDAYPDGVWLVELAPLADPALVEQAVCAVLGLREEPGRPLSATIADSLRPKRVLLILDNCEHIVAACAQLTDALIRRCPNLHVVATSREPLAIAGETTLLVPSLSVPEPPSRLARRPTFDGETAVALSQFEAVRLFIERGLAVQPGFQVTNENAPAVAQICHRLDGIPLAIELAAARVRVLSVEQLAARLDDRFRLLTGGSRTALPRQQTLRATIDWSYNLLREPERALLRRLSVFAGGWTLEAAEVVGSGDPVEDWEILDLLTALVDKSLVLTEGDGATVRYRLLETVREYAHARAVESGEAETVARRHQQYFLALAEQADEQIRGANHVVWARRLETEHDNLRAAIDWRGGDAESDEAAGRLVAALWWAWHLRGDLTEAKARLDAALTLGAGTRQTAAGASLLVGAGWLTGAFGDFSRAQQLLTAGLETARAVGDTRGAARGLIWCGTASQIQGNLPRARAFMEQAVEALERIDDPWGLGVALIELGFITMLQGAPAAGRPLTERGLRLLERTGDPWGIGSAHFNLAMHALAELRFDEAAARLQASLEHARALNDTFMVFQGLIGLGDVARCCGDIERATSLYEESLVRATEIGLSSGIASSHHNLGYTALHAGDLPRAADRFAEALARFSGLGDTRGAAECLAGLAGVATAAGDAATGARLFGAAAASLAAVGATMSPSNVPDYERNVAATRAALGEAFEAIFEAGRVVDLAAAAAEVDQLVGRVRRQPA